jgi:phosphoglycerate dehydrogenase-like enzyme
MCLKSSPINDKVVIKICSPADVLSELKDTHVVVPIMCNINRSMMEAAPYLSLIMIFGVDVSEVDLKAAGEMGIAVSHVPSEGTGNAESVAEHVIFLILSCLRRVSGMKQSLDTQKLGGPIGSTLLGSSVLLYGFGGVGRQVAKRIRPFGLRRLVAVKRTPLSDADDHNEDVDEVGLVGDVHRLAKGCDIAIVCMDWNMGNTGIVNKAFIDELSDGAILINISHGKCVNHKDVLAALHSSKLSGVGLDVFHTEPFPLTQSDPLLMHPRCVVTPHVAGVTDLAFSSIAAALTDNIERLISGQPLRNIVRLRAEP